MADLSARLSENNYGDHTVELNISAIAKSGGEYKSKVNVKAEDKEDEQYASEVCDIVSRLPVSTTITAPEHPSPPSVSVSRDRPKRPFPGPMKLPSAQGNQGMGDQLGLSSGQERHGFASALASAQPIKDLKEVPYPEGVRPNPEFNFAFTPRRFRYHREFLLQFMNVCKEVPHTAMPLVGIEALGLRPGDPASPTQARTGGRRVGLMGMAGAPIQRSGSVGLGFGPGLARGGFAMGNFQSPSWRLGDSQSRFEASTRAGVPFTGPAGSRLTSMTRGASQGGADDGGPYEAKRTRSQRGNNRWGMRGGFQTPNQQDGNRAAEVIEFHQLVDRQVKGLLRRLTMNNFDLISDQIIDWANRSEQEKDPSSLMLVIKLIFEKAKDDEERSELYAWLCRKMMERISQNVQDEAIRNAEGQPIRGGMLFRKYLLNRCQEDFERGWGAKGTALAASASKTGGVAEEGNDQAASDSNEYLVAAEARRQGLGLVRFIGELFKMQMLTERIMHECIKKLLSNVVNPEEAEIESLCKLLTTVGQRLDDPKARNHMDIYFERMQDMAKNSNINSRMQLMLLGVIELRVRQWQTSSVVSQPQSSKEGQGQRDDAQHHVQRGGSRRGERRPVTDLDGWNVASNISPRPPARAGDLSQFGKISKPTGIQFGPSRVFSKDPKSEAALSGSSAVNIFEALSSVDGPPAMAEHPTNSRKPSVDLGADGLLAALEAGSDHPVQKPLGAPYYNPQATIPQRVESSSLGVNAAIFFPGVGSGRRPVRITTPNGDPITFENQIQERPKFMGRGRGVPVMPKRASVVVRMETEQQKNMRLAKEQEVKDRKAREAKEQAEQEGRKMKIGREVAGEH